MTERDREIQRDTERDRERDRKRQRQTNRNRDRYQETETQNEFIVSLIFFCLYSSLSLSLFYGQCVLAFTSIANMYPNIVGKI